MRWTKGLVDLNDQAMREYIIEFVATAVEEFELDTFRTDFNINPHQAFLFTFDPRPLCRA